MKYVLAIIVAAWLAANPALTRAEEAGKHAAPEVQTLTGEVVDVTCYLSHPDSGIGKSHASCAKTCILNGLPVAIKVDEQLYLAVGDDHLPANQMLAAYAGQRVTVSGELKALDGQQLIVVSHVEKAR